MKIFFKDLWELQKESNKFIKKHWFGYIIFTIVSGILGAITGFFITKKMFGKYSENDLSYEEKS